MALCRCGSGQERTACCGSFLAGEPAPTAEVLMRSRYTAYVEKDAAYLLRTWHPETRPQAVEADDTQWLGLKIIRTEKGLPGDDEGVVEFAAAFRAGSKAKRLCETSLFKRLDGQWYYHSGSTRLEDVGRNEFCPCGSGKKFKRCCG